VRSVDVAVVGGGPAGAATACGLATVGREVVLIERVAGPHHKVCGEFISHETKAQLGRLGIDLSALGAVTIDRVYLVAGRRRAEVTLPFAASSLSRLQLDAAVLGQAEAGGAELWRDTRVLSAARAKTGWTLQCSRERKLRCANLVVATGKSALRGIPDARNRALVGLKIHLEASCAARLELAGQVQLFLMDEGYVGLELVENGIANLCLVFPASLVGQIGAGWAPLREFLARSNPLLGQRLETLSPLWERPLAVVCPRSGHIHAAPFPGNSYYPVGDRLAHIPPFTGDGLAIALATAAMAVGHLRRASTPVRYLAAAQRAIMPPVRTANVISRFVAGGGGRSLLMGAAFHAPWLIRAVARHTRTPLPE